MPHRILLRVGLPLPSKRWLLTRAAREVGVAVPVRAGPVRAGKLGSQALYLACQQSGACETVGVLVIHYSVTVRLAEYSRMNIVQPGRLD